MGRRFPAAIQEVWQATPPSRHLQQRLLDFVGKFHKNEIVGWIEIIFAFVIDHANVICFNPKTV
jgi:hypothetical protein